MCRRFLLVVAMSLAAAFVETGCDSDSPFSPGAGDAVPDTSSVTFVQLSFQGYVADGIVETGLELQWRLTFASTTGRWLRVARYTLARDSQLLLDRTITSPPTHKSGETFSGKERWIPVDAPTPAGDYLFRVYFETGTLWINALGDTVWTRLGRGTIDSSFTI